MMRLDPRLRSYSDIGRYAFGDKAQIGISLLFGAELWAVSVALIVLFGDSLYAMVHSNMRPSHVQTFVVASGIATWSPSAFKILGFFLVLPTVFVPLRFLSPISVIGILSTVTVLVILVTDGFLKPDYPGSLHHPAATLWPPEPPQWSKIPLSFGLIMSGFASHAIVPAIIRDMKEPERFPAMLNTAYVVATAIYLTMGITGYLMFGKGVSDEITRDVAQTKAYPQLLTKIAVWLIVVVPLTKFALASRPVLGIFEGLLGVEEPQTIAEADGHNEESNTMAGRVAEELEQDIDDANRPQGTLKHQSGSHISLNGVAPADPSRLPPPPSSISPRLRIVLRNLLRLVLTALILLTAIVFPEFERIMAFLGAFLAFTTCVIGPIMARE
jgi:vesicular inhibitory amino acid transporter